jgi:predicted dehydrogenase
MFMEEMRHFIAVAHGKEEPICTLEDGQRALQLALAVHQSQATGYRVQL